MIAYRIADGRHPIFDSTGAMLHGGRWNSIGVAVIYAAETYADALLEVLVHANLAQPPKNHRVIEIDIPRKVRIETVSVEQIRGWDAADMIASRAFGDKWAASARTAVLRVPSVITRGRGSNLVINPTHPQFAAITCSPDEPVHWDVRLFR
ncbi:MAG TPA: RES domain-containing protein [Acidobacteriaceae bacterium]|nr:RES domain-containing protein [Acidobacteriaceae bacterium]